MLPMNFSREIAKRNHKAISQSLDLFIIIGVVLAVGGLVAAVATGLIGSATNTASLQLTSYSIAQVGGTATSGTYSMTIKNVGTSNVAIGGSFVIKLATTNNMGASGACNVPTAYAGGTVVTFVVTSCTSATAITLTGPGTAVNLTPGQVLTVTVPSAISAGTDPFTTGLTYTISVNSGSQVILQNVISS